MAAAKERSSLDLCSATSREQELVQLLRSPATDGADRLWGYRRFTPDSTPKGAKQRDAMRRYERGSRFKLLILR